jgi:hypothetical protein
VKVIAEGTAILKATCDDWSLELRVTVDLYLKIAQNILINNNSGDEW